MKTNIFALSVSAAFLAVALSTGAFAQPPAPQPPASPEVVYVPQLPSPADLTNAASANGQTVAKIDQTNGQIVVQYQASNGTITTVTYRPMSMASNGQPAPQPGAFVPPVPPTAAPNTAMVAPGTTAVPNTTVVYDDSADYYSPYGYAGYYGGYPWWGLGYPVVGIGLGFGWGYHGGGYYHGGYYHGGGYRAGGYHGGGHGGNHR